MGSIYHTDIPCKIYRGNGTYSFETIVHLPESEKTLQYGFDLLVYSGSFLPTDDCGEGKVIICVAKQLEVWYIFFSGERMEYLL